MIYDTIKRTSFEPNIIWPTPVAYARLFVTRFLGNKKPAQLKSECAWSNSWNPLPLWSQPSLGRAEVRLWRQRLFRRPPFLYNHVEVVFKMVAFLPPSTRMAKSFRYCCDRSAASTECVGGWPNYVYNLTTAEFKSVIKKRRRRSTVTNMAWCRVSPRWCPTYSSVHVTTSSDIYPVRTTYLLFNF